MIGRRPTLIIAACLALWCFRPAALLAQAIDAFLDGDQIRVVAPGLHFLAGDTLKTLRDGASVSLIIDAGVTSGRPAPAADPITARFTISYDLWEEKYAVTRTGPTTHAISHLSLAGAERWCLDQVGIPAARVPNDQTFWIALTYRTEEPLRRGDASDRSRFTLGGLIDAFSQRGDRPRPGEARTVSGGPFRLADLRKRR